MYGGWDLVEHYARLVYIVQIIKMLNFPVFDNAFSRNGNGVSQENQHGNQKLIL